MPQITEKVEKATEILLSAKEHLSRQLDKEYGTPQALAIWKAYHIVRKKAQECLSKATP